MIARLPPEEDPRPFNGFAPDHEESPPGDGPAPWRPRGLIRWWLHEVRGWPRGLAPDRELLERCLHDTRDPAVMEDLAARLRRTEEPLGRFPWAFAFVELIAYVPLVILPFTHGLGTTLAWLAVVILVEWQIGRPAFQGWWHPRFRALLRRHGVASCIRCGHVAGGRHPGGACPECGQPHEHVPVGWGRDLAPG